MAPEVRDGQPGEPASDVYTAGAVLYYAATGTEPALDPAAIKRPSELRPTTPRTLERIIVRALRAEPNRRYLSAGEMLEDFASEAGAVEAVSVRPAGAQLDTTRRPRGGMGEAPPPRAGRRLRTARHGGHAAGSGGSIVRATCISSGKWRSRCCIRR